MLLAAGTVLLWYAAISIAAPSVPLVPSLIFGVEGNIFSLRRPPATAKDLEIASRVLLAPYEPTVLYPLPLSLTSNPSFNRFISPFRFLPFQPLSGVVTYLDSISGACSISS